LLYPHTSHTVCPKHNSLLHSALAHLTPSTSRHTRT
jgi:hypothetical protein